MDLFTLGFVLDTAGKVLIGIAVLAVHHRIFNEHKIDREVLNAMRLEWGLSLAGIALIIVGAVLQIAFHV